VSQCVCECCLEPVGVHGVGGHSPGLQEGHLCCCDQQTGVAGHWGGDGSVNLYSAQAAAAHTSQYAVSNKSKDTALWQVIGMLLSVKQ
jgi:hypothetical protein